MSDNVHFWSRVQIRHNKSWDTTNEKLGQASLIKRSSSSLSQLAIYKSPFINSRGILSLRRRRWEIQQSALCASLKSGKRLIISIIGSTICCGVKKTLIFFYKTVEFCLCVHILLLHYFSIFQSTLGAKRTTTYIRYFQNYLFFTRWTFFVTNTRNVLKRSLDVD